MRLTAADARLVLAFLADVDTIGADAAYSPALLARLGDLISYAEIGYQCVDLEARRFVALTPGEQPDEDDALYWAVGPCPITNYRARTGDLRAVTMSDVIGRQRYHELPVYREFLRPAGLDHVLDIGLSRTAHQLRSLVLFRTPRDPDFSDRDRAVLDALRPHLLAREARTELHLRAQDPRAPGATHPASDIGTDHGQEALTSREREVIYLAAQGKSNAEIASALWVTPATVKKHLENIYGKLGVENRAAAVATVQPAVGSS